MLDHLIILENHLIPSLKFEVLLDDLLLELLLFLVVEGPLPVNFPLKFLLFLFRLLLKLTG